MFLGYRASMNGNTIIDATPVCEQVTGNTTGDCAAPRTAVTAAVQPAHGPAVLGGRDWVVMEDGTQVPKEGQFLARDRDGTERAIPGDPGDATVAMSADPSGRVVWAITKEGSTYSVQKYRV